MSADTIATAEQLIRDCELGPGCRICLTLKALLALLAEQAQALEKGERVFQAVVYAFEGKEVPEDLQAHGMVNRARKFRAEQAQALQQVTAQRDKWLKAFNESEQFQNGPTKRAEQAEAQVEALSARLRAGEDALELERQCGMFLQTYLNIRAALSASTPVEKGKCPECGELAPAMDANDPETAGAFHCLKCRVVF